MLNVFISQGILKIVKEFFKLIFESSATNILLPAEYITRKRGKIHVKGKGEMCTYWLDSRRERNVPSKMEIMGQVIMLVMKNRGFFPKEEKIEEERRLKNLFLEN